MRKTLCLIFVASNFWFNCAIAEHAYPYPSSSPVMTPTASSQPTTATYRIPSGSTSMPGSYYNTTSMPAMYSSMYSSNYGLPASADSYTTNGSDSGGYCSATNVPASSGTITSLGESFTTNTPQYLQTLTPTMTMGQSTPGSQNNEASLSEWRSQCRCTYIVEHYPNIPQTRDFDLDDNYLNSEDPSNPINTCVGQALAGVYIPKDGKPQQAMPKVLPGYTDANGNSVLVNGYSGTIDCFMQCRTRQRNICCVCKYQDNDRYTGRFRENCNNWLENSSCDTKLPPIAIPAAENWQGNCLANGCTNYIEHLEGHQNGQYGAPYVQYAVDCAVNNPDTKVLNFENAGCNTFNNTYSVPSEFISQIQADVAKVTCNNQHISIQGNQLLGLVNMPNYGAPVTCTISNGFCTNYYPPCGGRCVEKYDEGNSAKCLSKDGQVRTELCCSGRLIESPPNNVCPQFMLKSCNQVGQKQNVVDEKLKFVPAICCPAHVNTDEGRNYWIPIPASGTCPPHIPMGQSCTIAEENLVDGQYVSVYFDTDIQDYVTKIKLRQCCYTEDKYSCSNGIGEFTYNFKWITRYEYPFEDPPPPGGACKYRLCEQVTDPSHKCNQVDTKERCLNSDLLPEWVVCCKIDNQLKLIPGESCP